MLEFEFLSLCYPLLLWCLSVSNSSDSKRMLFQVVRHMKGGHQHVHSGGHGHSHAHTEPHVHESHVEPPPVEPRRHSSSEETETITKNEEDEDYGMYFNQATSSFKTVRSQKSTLESRDGKSLKTCRLHCCHSVVFVGCNSGRDVQNYLHHLNHEIVCYILSRFLILIRLDRMRSVRPLPFFSSSQKVSGCVSPFFVFFWLAVGLSARIAAIHCFHRFFPPFRGFPINLKQLRIRAESPKHSIF